MILACIDFVELSKVDPATKKTIRIIKDGNICSSDVGKRIFFCNIL